MTKTNPLQGEFKGGKFNGVINLTAGWGILMDIVMMCFAREQTGRLGYCYIYLLWWRMREKIISMRDRYCPIHTPALRIL